MIKWLIVVVHPSKLSIHLVRVAGGVEYWYGSLNATSWVEVLPRLGEVFDHPDAGINHVVVTLGDRG